jgi:hypothetical protein
MSTGCRVFKPTLSSTASVLPPLPGQSTGVFTTERPTIRAALDDFLGRRPIPQQPIEFPHNVHVNKKIPCTLCHQGADKGAVAGIPSVAMCMTCHQAIATERPRIKQVAALRAKGLDLAWQRVFGFVDESHVTFNHAPHIRAKVDCATCHGNIEAQTVAQRNVNLTMGFCVTCHRQRSAPTDCMTCHY